MERTIHQHINDDRNELDNPITNGQRRRHLEDELSLLEQYQINNPNDDHDPTALEIYCDSNPNALECRIYDN
jgi:hypothetical protein